MKYLLPCTCGQTIPVDVGQAGQRVVCAACGQTLEVPTMRGIRALVPVEEPGSQQNAGRQPVAWSPVQGGLFSSGLLVIAIGLALAAYCGLVVSRIDTEKPKQLTDFDNFVDKKLETIPVDEAYLVHQKLKSEGIGPLVPPDYVIFQRISARYTNYLIASLVGAGVGMALVGISLVMKP